MEAGAQCHKKVSNQPIAKNNKLIYKDIYLITGWPLKSILVLRGQLHINPRRTKIFIANQCHQFQLCNL